METNVHKAIELKNQLFINNDWVSAAGGETFETVNPSTEEVICSVPRGRKADVDAACKAAHAALGGAWSEITPFERGRLLFKLADLVEQNQEYLASLESIDVGKPLHEALGDMKGVANCFRYNAGAADKMEGSTIPLGRNFVDYTSLEPIGVTAHIVPWNFPLGMAARSLAPALAAGCTAVLKPAEQSPLTALAFGDLCKQAGIPAGVVNIVTGFGEEAGDALVRHPLVRGITFTGSIETGRKVYAAAAAGIKSVVLELGGKNPMIVFADADIDRATTDALDASFGNSGQVCSSSSRYILHKAIKEDFLTQLAKKVATLTVGLPEENPTLGPLVSKEQYEKVRGYIEQGKKDGARIRFGGGRPPALDKGYFVEPTVFDEVAPTLSIAREEIFGPVSVVHTFETEAEALDLANGLETGLVAGIYTRDISRAHALTRKLDFGSIWINGWFIGGLQAPTGGEKLSGIGRERGLPGIMNYLMTKNIGIRL
jgi:acyl-CoA reductase-like NAD-dependent aldehyde dehydrogenase